MHRTRLSLGAPGFKFEPQPEIVYVAELWLQQVNIICLGPGKPPRVPGEAPLREPPGPKEAPGTLLGPQD